LNSYFSSDHGTLCTDGQVLTVQGLTRTEFNRGQGQHMSVQEYTTDFVVYGPISVELWGQHFVAGVRFFREVVHGATLTRAQSKVATLGYDATEKDLLSEKTSLTTLLTQKLKCSPTSWGGVISKADLKSTWCGIEVRYK
jgi:hypothetical protein